MQKQNQLFTLWPKRILHQRNKSNQNKTPIFLKPQTSSIQFCPDIPTLLPQIWRRLVWLKGHYVIFFLLLIQLLHIQEQALYFVSKPPPISHVCTFSNKGEIQTQQGNHEHIKVQRSIWCYETTIMLTHQIRHLKVVWKVFSLLHPNRQAVAALCKSSKALSMAHMLKWKHHHLFLSSFALSHSPSLRSSCSSGNRAKKQMKCCNRMKASLGEW